VRFFADLKYKKRNE